MNKALHAFVYLFVVLTGVAIFFEASLHKKREEMKDRNRLQENFIIEVAGITETGDDFDREAKHNRDYTELDVSPVEAKIVDSPDTEDMLGVNGYAFWLEKLDHKFFAWGQNEREKLRSVYVRDSEGNVVMDGNKGQTEYSEEDKLLKVLKKALEAQKDNLAETRKAVTVVREQLQKTIEELNKLKQEARQDKVTIVQRDESIARLQEENAALNEKIAGLNQQIKELNSDITSLKDEVQVANDEKEAVREELEKEKKLTAQLKKLVQDLQATLRGGAGVGGGDAKAISNLKFGEKGKVVSADNALCIAVVELSDETIRELKGEDLSRPMPLVELNVVRKGFNGPAGEIVGRLRIRQEYSGKNLVVCEILDSWKQAPIEVGDVLIAD